MLAALHRGRWVHVAPLGYLSGSRNGPSLVIDPTRAPMLRRAFAQVAAHVPIPDVLSEIHALGLRTKSNKRLSLQTAHSILRNPIYAGRLELKAWNVSQSGDFEALVTPELFQSAQVALSSRKGARVRHHWENPDFPLRRFVRCSSCEAPLTGSWSSLGGHPNPAINRHFKSRN